LARSKLPLATAFIAKAILNLGTTRALIARLKVDEPLRRLCGWSSASKLPHEAKFSRAFAEFAATELPQQLHAAVIELTLKDQLMGHVAHDATAIPLRERYPNSAKAMKRAKPKKNRKKDRKGKHSRAKAAERGTRIQRQRHQTLALASRFNPTAFQAVSFQQVSPLLFRARHSGTRRGDRLRTPVAGQT
jgi:hypothetical protein